MDTQSIRALRMQEAWKRYRRLMRVMLLLTLLVLAGAFTWLYAVGTPMPLHFIFAVALAVIGSLMLAAALMGLAFFSNASGADDAPDTPDDAP